MRPHLLKIPLRSEHSFNVRYDRVSHFYDKWHYHEEVELVYIIKGSGTQFVGDSIRYFNDGDLMLLGANLPHLWKSDEKFLLKSAIEKVEAIVLHFRPDCFGSGFFEVPENRDLHRLLQRGGRGIRVSGRSRSKAARIMHQLLQARGSERIILLIQLLQTIASGRQNEFLCNPQVTPDFSASEADRLNTIYQYILENFAGDINLKKVADRAHMTPQSFCRYFKSRTKKTFSDFLTEVRIGHACKLLAETDLQVAEICYESGFNNFSNFNRHFKALRKLAPLQYRKQHQEEEKEAASKNEQPPVKYRTI